MANRKALSMQTSIPGLEIMIWYNDANNRLGAVEWTVPQGGIAIRVRVWDANISATVPVVDRTAATSGSQNIPGNHTMVEVTENGDTWVEMPAYFSWTFNIESIG